MIFLTQGTRKYCPGMSDFVECTGLLCQGNRMSAICLAAWIGGSILLAHHSISGVYDMGREVVLEGQVLEFRFVNPHPFLIVSIQGGDGTEEEWRLEMDNRSELARIDVDRTTLLPGDRIVVRGHPARNEPRGLYIRRLDRPADGFSYEQVGNSPRIRSSR